jgi:Holliday junction resolvase RusA-like endonuclease
MTIRTTDQAHIVTGQGTWDLYLPISPVPAARPRVGRYGTYYPPKYKQWKTMAEAMLLDLETSVAVVTIPVFVATHVVAPRPKNPANDYPSPDLDNYIKAAWDAITSAGLIWQDDKQIVAMYGTKRWADAGEEPHVRVRACIGDPSNLPSDGAFLSEDALDHAVGLDELEEEL